MKGRDEHHASQEHWGIHGPDGNEFSETFATKEAALAARDAIARQARSETSKYALWCTRLGDCPHCGPTPASTIITTQERSNDGRFIIRRTIITSITPVGCDGPMEDV